MIISLGRRSPDDSSDLPGSRSRAGASRRRRSLRIRRRASLFGLAPGGVCQAGPVARIAGELLPRRFTLTHDETNRQRRFVFCGTFPTRLTRAVGVTHHRAPRSPDFPLRSNLTPMSPSMQDAKRPSSPSRFSLIILYIVAMFENHHPR